MNPIEPPEYEGTYRTVWKGPTPEIGDLVTRYDPSRVANYSLWALSFEERQAILDGANVILSVAGRVHPPVRLMVQGVDASLAREEGA